MISYLKGKIKFKTDKYIALDVNNVGYQLFIPQFYLESIKEEEEKEFFVHLQVREDNLTFYGFTSKDELDFFETLIKISDVGPKSALGVISLAPLNELKMIIAEGNADRLTGVAGVGKKTAARIILELKDKIEFAIDGQEGRDFTYQSEIVEALTRMGYKANEVKDALSKISFSSKDPGEQIKEVLKRLGGK